MRHVNLQHETSLNAFSNPFNFGVAKGLNECMKTDFVVEGHMWGFPSRFV